MRLWMLFFACALTPYVQAADIVTYFGTTGRERLYGALELSNGKILVCGAADDLGWVPSGALKVQLSASTADGNVVPNYDSSDHDQAAYSFIALLSSNLSAIEKVYHFPKGVGGAIRDIKTTQVPGQTEGELFVSGIWTNATHTTPDQLWIGKLDNNVLSGDPSMLSWIHKDLGLGGGGSTKFMQNWDVGGDGKVVYYSYKRPSAGAWGALYRLNTNGTCCDNVENWWGTTEKLISLKPHNHHLRSLTQEDFDLVTSHSGKGKKKGKYPFDYYFKGPKGVNDDDGGYTGYRSDGKPATTVAIAIDRRDNTMYVGFNTPVANNTHDFEPQLMRMAPDGSIAWYSHLYSGWIDENNDNVIDPGEAQQSPPDHYVDAVAVDYSRPATDPQIVVLARSHGNAPRNLWSGTNSFHGTFTGTNGNEHQSWIGRFRGNDGYFVNATWLAEYDPFKANFGAPYDDPILDGWPDHNKGWASLKTTLGRSLSCDLDGHVYVCANSRGPLTTSNAFQKMTMPGSDQYGCWADFVRVHTPDFGTLDYSSTLVGSWDPATGNGGGNSQLKAVIPVTGGLIVVGYHPYDAGNNTVGDGSTTTSVVLQGGAPLVGMVFQYGDAKRIITAFNEVSKTVTLDLALPSAPSNGSKVSWWSLTKSKGDPIPTANVPSWGTSQPQWEAGIIAKLEFSKKNELGAWSTLPTTMRKQFPLVRVSGNAVQIGAFNGHVELINCAGRVIATQDATKGAALPMQASGILVLKLKSNTGVVSSRTLVSW